MSENVYISLHKHVTNSRTYIRSCLYLQNKNTEIAILYAFTSFINVCLASAFKLLYTKCQNFILLLI